MLFWLSVFGSIWLAVCYVLYVSRQRWVPLLPLRLQSYVKTYAPLATFDEAVEQGFSVRTWSGCRDFSYGAQTGNFNLADNAGDSRAGLDDQGLAEVRRLMDRHGISFDEARLKRQENIFRANGIDPKTGLPLDKKAITHL